MVLLIPTASLMRIPLQPPGEPRRPNSQEIFYRHNEAR